VTLDPAITRVVVRFLGLFALFVALIAVVGTFASWSSLTGLTTSVATTLIRATGVEARSQGSLIVMASHSLLVDLPCTAIYMVALYSSLVLAYPVSVRARVLGLVFGIPILAVANMARIVTAAQLSTYAPEAFQFFHDYLYQVALALVCALTWAMWLAYARHSSS